MHTQFTNKDIDLCSKILRWFNYIGAKKSDMTFIIAYNKGRIDDIESDIRKHLKLFSQKIGRRKTDRNKYPTFAIQVNGKVFRILLEKIMKTSLGYIKKKSKLRRAWLRGYFAAEGCVAYHSTERYLASVSFAYNPKTEVWLRNYCLELLKLEGIKSQISIRHENSNGSVIITNWKNYYQLWKIGLFDGCERKKQKFESIIKHVRISCHLDNEFRRKLFSGINQYELAKILNTYQASISNIVNGTERNMWPTVEQIRKICEIKGVSLDELKENVIDVRFGTLTHLDPNEELLNDIFRIKA